MALGRAQDGMQPELGCPSSLVLSWLWSHDRLATRSQPGHSRHLGPEHSLCCAGCPGMLICFPGLHLLDAGSTLPLSWQPEMSRCCSVSPGGGVGDSHSCPLLRTPDLAWPDSSPEIFKGDLSFFTHLTCFLPFVCLAFGHAVQHVGSLTRDRTHLPCSGSSVLTTGLPGKSLTLLISNLTPERMRCS